MPAAPVSMTPATGKHYFWQWIPNQYLAVTGDVSQVHFAQPGQDTALVVVVADGLAAVPNELLQAAGILVAYACTPDRTWISGSWEIRPRQKPSNYVYTPTEVLRWETIQAAADEALRIAQKVRSEFDTLVLNGGVVDGGYYTPAVDSEGALSWTPSRSGMPEVSSANIKGPQGATGPQGEKGERGATGLQGAKGDTGPQGSQGLQGIQGAEGVQGAAGYAPVRGTDYWTDEDKQAIINAVLAAIGSSGGGTDNSLLFTVSTSGHLILTYASGTEEPDFALVDGHLILTYPDGTEEPDYEMQNGHLIYTY